MSSWAPMLDWAPMLGWAPNNGKKMGQIWIEIRFHQDFDDTLITFHPLPPSIVLKTSYTYAESWLKVKGPPVRWRGFSAEAGLWRHRGPGAAGCDVTEDRGLPDCDVTGWQGLIGRVLWRGAHWRPAAEAADCWEMAVSTVLPLLALLACVTLCSAAFRGRTLKIKPGEQGRGSRAQRIVRAPLPAVSDRSPVLQKKTGPMVATCRMQCKELHQLEITVDFVVK